MHHKRSRLLRRRGNADGQNGIALLTTLLLLLLLTGISLAMVMTVRGDILVNGYYRNNRGSFYAADSGLNVARQAVYNLLQTDINSLPATYTPQSGPPLTVTVGSTVGEDQKLQQLVQNSYGSTAVGGPGWQPLTGSSQGTDPTRSWSAQFQISGVSITPTNLAITCGTLSSSGQFTAKNCTFNPGPGPSTPSPYLTCSVSSTSNTSTALSCPFTGWPTNAISYQYAYSYALTAQGRTSVGNNELTSLTDTGYIQVNSSNQQQTNFAGYGFFIGATQAPCSGDLVGGTISGPVFTNGAWTFSSSSSYTFTDSVGQANADAGFDFGSAGCDSEAVAQYTNSKGQSDKPTYQSGPLKLGQTAVQLPPNSYSQEQAVIDSTGTSNFNPCTPNPPNETLQTMKGVPYVATGTGCTPPSSGVYLPYKASGTGGTYGGGGIIIEGNAAVTLSPGSNGSQVYQIVQGSGSSAVTTTITITPSGGPGAGTTVVTQQIGTGTPTTLNLNGVPVIDNPDGSQSNAAMVYVDGNITSLSGPPGTGSSVNQAIQNNTDITITAAGSVNLTGSISYGSGPVGNTSNEPVTQNSSDSLTGSQAGILGIFTAGTDCVGQNNCGNINLDFPLVNGNPGNWEIDASLACLSSANIANGSSGQLVNTGAAINLLDIVGGRIQNTLGDINTSTRNVYFDRRFTNGVAPPWFPSTSFVAGSYTTTATIQRTGWINSSGSF